MPVIKPGQSNTIMRSAVVLDMGDVEVHAHRVLTDAHDRASVMVNEAERLARHMTANADQKGHAAGHQRGFEEGRLEGLRAGREEALRESRAAMQTLNERWTAAIEQWEARRERMHAEAREDVLRFAFALGERVIHRMLQIDPSIVHDQLVAALALLGRPSAMQVSVHPDDRAAVEAVLPDVKAALGRASHVHLHDDPAVERGGCVLATTSGYVDATIATQLDRLAEAVLRNGRLIERSTTSDARAARPSAPADAAP